MADYDPPMDTSPEGPVYPDIDENMHYPWQGNQQSATDNVPASVIDPRLYQDLFSQTAPKNLGQQDSADELSDDSQAYPPVPNGEDLDDDDDADFVYAEDESER